MLRSTMEKEDKKSTAEEEKKEPSPAKNPPDDVPKPPSGNVASLNVPKPPSGIVTLKYSPTNADAAEEDSKPAPKVTLSDVQETFPFESNEERHVMEHIERIDPTIGETEAAEEEASAMIGGRLYNAPSSGLTGSERSKSSLLLGDATSLPAELVESLQSEKLEEMKEESRRKAMERSKSRNTSKSSSQSVGKKKSGGHTVEDDLFELTNQLRPNQAFIHLAPVAEDGSLGDTSADDDTDEEKVPLTQAQTFAHNAAGMFHKVSKGVETRRSSLFGSGNAKEGDEPDSNHGRSSLHSKTQTVVDNLKEVERIVARGKKSIKQTIRNAMFVLILPCTAIAFFLFYVLDNPGAVVIFVPTNGTQAPSSNSFESSTRVVSNEQPSYSWLFLFFGVRQVITFNLAVGIQYLLITYYSQAGVNFLLAGPMTRLLIIQAKGWPLILIFWGFLDLAMLYGNTRFANHWLYYQNFIGIFNEDNPSGNFPSFDIYKNLVIFALCSGIAVALKRFIIGLRFGQTSYFRYADRLSSVLKDILQISRTARLPEMKKEYISKTRATFVEEAIECNIWLERHAYVDHEALEKEGDGGSAPPATSLDASGHVRPSLDLGSFREDLLSSAQQLKIEELLGEWEEIELADTSTETPSLSAIVQFGSSVGILESSYPFGQAFGRAETRHQVIDCAQHVYADLLKLQRKLMIQQVYQQTGNGGADPETTLKFHTLSIVAMDDIGGLDMKLAKELMHVFRPSREGDITLVEFVKSIDTVYKEVRKLRASVANESKMNAGTEKIINAAFYFILIFCFLAAIGMDPVVIFGGLAAFVISFSFCVSGASSDYIKGLLFILVQRPYDIGKLCCPQRVEGSCPQDLSAAAYFVSQFL
ncbi:MAG: hypothetical protein SGILL_003135 [Bacillariaceae sp.]